MVIAGTTAATTVEETPVGITRAAEEIKVVAESQAVMIVAKKIR
jgi:hypothetical protein